MRPIKYAAAAVLVLAVFLSLFFVAEDSSADIEYTDIAIIIHDTEVLTEDLVFPDESNIIINLDTHIDISEYTLDFGKDSNIAIMGFSTISCTTGKVIVREGTNIIMFDAAVPKLETDVTLTFDGTVSFEGIPLGVGATVSLEPNGNDRCIHAAWNNSALAVQDPVISYKITLQGIDLKTGFTYLNYHEEYTEEGDINLTRDLNLVSSNRDSALDFLLSTNLNIDISQGIDSLISADLTFQITLDIDSLDFTKYVANSDMTQKLVMNGTGPLKIFTDSKLMMTVKATAEEVEISNSKGDELRRHGELTDVEFDMKADLTVIAVIIEEEDLDVSDYPNIIKSLHITAATGTVKILESRPEKEITDISVTIDGREGADPYFLATFMDGERYNEIRADKLILESFGITNDLKITFLINIPHITYTSSGGDLHKVSVQIDDLQVETDNLVLGTLMDDYYRSGELTLQQLLDNARLFRLYVGALQIDTDGDMEIDTIGHELDARLAKDTRGVNTLVVSFEDFLLPLHNDEDNKDYLIYLDRSEAYLESGSAMNEILDAFTEKIDFSGDTNAQIQLVISGGWVEIVGETENTNIVLVKKSSESPAGAVLTFGIEYLRYTDETTLSGRLNATGYEVYIMHHQYYADPEGTSDSTFVLNDTVASFSFVFNELMEFSADVRTPLDLDINYYDVEMKIGFGESVVNITHGQLYLDGYDPVSEGMLAVLSHIAADDDFVFDMKVDLVSDHIDIYGEGGKDIIDVYTDLDVSVKEIFMLLEHDVYMLIDVDGVSIEYKTKDGSDVLRTIGHLDIDKDYIEPDPRKDVVVYTSEIMLISFSIMLGELLLVLIVLRIKRPDLFKFGQQEF